MAVITPKLVQTKIYKTGQTRGADDDVIYQNRVGRNSTVLIPYHEFEKCKVAPTLHGVYENGYIVLISPEDYFNEDIRKALSRHQLILGENLLVFYETRLQWNTYKPLKKWQPASSRKSPLGGQYVARVPATTSEDGNKIIHGFNTSKMKGAGIRVYEYADMETVKSCKIQLEYLFWSCKDVSELIKESGMDEAAVRKRMVKITYEAESKGLADKKKLVEARILDKDGYTICPLCLKRISAKGFCAKL